MRLARTAAPLPRSVDHKGRVDDEGLAGRSRTCDLRRPKPAGWPRSPTTRCNTPGGARTRSFRVEGPASSPVRPRGRELRRQGSNLRLTINSRASFRLDYTGTNGGSRIRTCGRAPHAYALATRRHQPLGHASEAEGEGVEPPRPRSPPAFETGYRAGGSPSKVAPAGVEPAPHRLRVGGSSC